MPDPRCSDSSLAAHEPLAGTAVSRTSRWLALEYRPHWEAKGVERAVFSPEVRGWLDRFLARPHTRVQLVRRQGRTGPLACFYADTTPGTGRVHQVELSRYEELLDHDVDRLIEGDTPWEARPGPLLWVCTHGKRDRCCALHGGRLYAALRRELGEAVWQTSHLGGHRFAATLLSLPDGLCYGRLRVDDAQPLADAIQRGEIFRIDRLRGRVAWSAAAQSAEVELRQRLGSLDPGAVTLEHEDGEQVTLRASGQLHTLQVHSQPLPAPVIPSCGKAPAPASGLVAR